MIEKNELNILFEWAKNTELPLRFGPTADGYSSVPIKFCWLKKNRKNSIIRKSTIKDQKIEKILENDDILFSMFVVFDPGTELGPHKDPNIYKEPYKRIQIPIEIPDKDKCYMIWNGEKVFWEEGVPQIYEVMDYIHEGYNLSDKPMKFLFIDIKRNSIIY
jgi:hypothetical protein